MIVVCSHSLASGTRLNQMFGPPQPAASTKALSGVESSSTSDPKTAAQNPASASASAASNDTDSITAGTPAKLAVPAPPGHLDFLERTALIPEAPARHASPQMTRSSTADDIRNDK